jgi:hypothetical protein
MNIGFIIFMAGIVLFIIGIALYILDKKLIKVIPNLLPIGILVFGIAIAFSSLLFLHIIPYTKNISNTYDIEAYEKDIEYYKNKIEKYEEEDKKILKEWAKQQEEMAEKLSSLGMQFAGDIQPNNIIKKLSGEIKTFHNKIDETQIKIHQLESDIKARENHMWYWGF